MAVLARIERLYTCALDSGDGEALPERLGLLTVYA
jgi:hypothetical protein